MSSLVKQFNLIRQVMDDGGYRTTVRMPFFSGIQIKFKKKKGIRVINENKIFHSVNEAGRTWGTVLITDVGAPKRQLTNFSRNRLKLFYKTVILY